MSELFSFASKYIAYKPKSAATILQQFSLVEIKAFLLELDTDILLTALESMDPIIVSSLLLMLPSEKAVTALAYFPLNFTAHVLQTTQDEHKQTLVNLLSDDVRKQVERRMQYLPDTAGSYMDSRIIYFKETETVDRCIERIKKKSRTFYYVFIVNEESTLIGVTTIRKLIEEQGKNLVCSQLMDSPVESIKIDHNAHEIIENPSWATFSCLPVVDYQEKFLGVIGHSTLNKLKNSLLKDTDDQDVRLVGSALSELYSIGFSALIGSASSVPEVERYHE